MTNREKPSLDRTVVIEEEMPKTEAAPTLGAPTKSLTGTVVIGASSPAAAAADPVAPAEHAQMSTVVSDEDEIRAARALLRARKQGNSAPNAAPFPIAPPLPEGDRNEPTAVPPWKEALRVADPVVNPLLQTLATYSARARADAAVEPPAAEPTPPASAPQHAAAPDATPTPAPRDEAYGKHLPAEPPPSKDARHTAQPRRDVARVAERKDVGRGLYSGFKKS